MSEKISARRIIVCVDGVTDSSDTASKKLRRRNPSSIARLRAVIKSGICTDQQRRPVQQTVRYHQVASASFLAGKFSSGPALSFDQQVQDVAFDICQSLEDPQDEIYLFGSAHGACTVRAVAGVLHHMGMPRSGTLSDFPEMFQNALKLYKARQTDDSISGGRALQFLRERTRGMPNIRFVGVLDALKSPTSRNSFDTGFVTSIRHFRHALAFNENRPSLALDLPQSPTTKDLEGRSFIQAWFMGSHGEIIGGTTQDGLSLYPLQWLMVESMLQGLVVSPDEIPAEFNLSENPLSLTFPQFAGEAPELDVAEKVKWNITYTNQTQVVMFDLQTAHVPAPNAEDPSHEIGFESTSSLYTSSRKIFSIDGLHGYDRANSAGTIIHPSVFCILDRNQRLYEQTRFKPYKSQLADFEINCMRGSPEEQPPWIQGSELLGSNVKAFRILVCGKTGVGKSTLINKVFGVEMVRYPEIGID